MTQTKTTRTVLARYAGLLGRNSLAADCLRDFDTFKRANKPVEIHRTNSGFRLVCPNPISTNTRNYG